MKGYTGLVAIAVFFLIAIIFVYNRLISKRNNADSAWSNIDVQLQRRYDLIPNLVETVRAYARHERDVFERIAVLRNSFKGATTPNEVGEIEQQMSLAVKHLFAVAENYPDLKANQNFLMLQESLAGTENRIAYSRNNYNHAVMDYNTGIQTFPGSIIAGIFGFRAKEFFEISESEMRENVKVKMN